MRVLLFALMFVACSTPVAKPPESDIVPPTPPATIDSDNEKACAAIERVGCPEAKPPPGALSCVAAFAQAEGDKANIRYACFAAAATKEAVRACGGVGYFTVRCK